MSRRKRSRAAAMAAKHVALVPLAAHDEDHEDEDDGCCIDCGQPWELYERHPQNTDPLLVPLKYRHERDSEIPF